ncbi:hypothetical protein TNCV_580051 [Trichonephila clavipes]|nr:hypothetical protein TNCV_580051 [Trichonephila clavipes]
MFITFAISLTLIHRVSGTIWLTLMMFSLVVAVFVRPERSSSPKLLRPRSNSAAQNFTVIIDGAKRAHTQDPTHLRFADEAHFWLNGYVNKQNCRIWSEANPQVYVESPLHPEKLTVWGALWAGGILLQKR